MAKFFTFKSKDIKNFEKILKNSPKKFSKSSANVLNDLAFKGKQSAPGIIKKLLTVRDEKFISKSLIVEKASKSAPLNNQKATFGMINRPRFTGLKEQEEGSKDTRKRIPTLGARRGSRKRSVMPYLRIKPGIKVIRSGSRRNEQAAIAIAKRRRSKEVLELKYQRNAPRGFYRIISDKLILISKKEGLGKPIKRKPWMEKTVDSLVKDNVMISSWKKAIKREFRL